MIMDLQLRRQCHGWPQHQVPGLSKQVNQTLWNVRHNGMALASVMARSIDTTAQMRDRGVRNLNVMYVLQILSATPIALTRSAHT
jgi:hypothetical protein